jgi:hypothetical protein
LLFLALQRLYFVLLASLGLIAQDFFELIRGCPCLRGREDERNDEIADKPNSGGFHDSF